jgi:hypothetical protein
MHHVGEDNRQPCRRRSAAIPGGRKIISSSTSKNLTLDGESPRKIRHCDRSGYFFGFFRINHAERVSPAYLRPPINAH